MTLQLRDGIQEKLDEYKIKDSIDIVNIISKTVQLVYRKNSKNPEITLGEDMLNGLVIIYLNGCCRLGSTDRVDPNKLSKFKNIKEDDPNLTYSVYLCLDTVFSS